MSETVRARAKMHETTFVDFDIFNGMRELYSVTLAYLLKVKSS